MRRTEAGIALVAGACLAACSAGAPDAARSTASATATQEPATITAAQAMPPPVEHAAVEQDPIRTPTAGDARQVVIDYYAAIDTKRYQDAYALWSDGGAASGQSFEHFSGGYANTESVEAEVGEASGEEGAAGSRYINVPVTLRARQYNGSVRVYRGRFALRAVVADGASEQQKRWHLDSAEMQRIP